MSEIFVPGRLCILGEHTDWAAEYIHQNPSLCKGHTIVCATNEGLYARLHPYSTNHFRFDHTSDSGLTQTFESPLILDKLHSTASNGGFFSYIAGTIAVILESEAFKISSQKTHSKYSDVSNGITASHDISQIKGLFIENYLTTLPMQKGLSSSAAICVMIVLSFNEWFQMQLSQAEVMELAYLGEMLTPSHCGRMDQCVVMGSNAIAIMEFENKRCSLERISCAKNLFFVVIDLMAHKDTVKILHDLNDCFPFPADDQKNLMHDYVHGIEAIAKRAKEAIENGEIQALAQSMKDAQSLFDRCAMPNCSSELTAPKLHQIMSDSFLQKESLAIKGVGSQGDGSAQILCENVEQQKKVLDYVIDRYGVHGFLLTISGQE